MIRFGLAAAASLLIASLTQTAQAQPVFWVEGTDIPGGGNSLQTFTFDIGTNTLIGTLAYGGSVVDFDSFAFIVPPGKQISAGTLTLYTAQNRYYREDWDLNTGLIYGNGQLRERLSVDFLPGLNNPTVRTLVNMPLHAGAYNMSNTGFNAEMNSVAVWRFDFDVTLEGGACCNGINCAVVPSNLCTGTFMGGDTVCGPVICCGAPIGSPLAANDCDGDLVQDACTTLTPASDCNSNSAADSCETLVFSNTDFNGSSGAFTFNGTSAVELPAGYALLTSFQPGETGTIVRPPLTAGVTQRMRVMFDFRISAFNTQPADGISFSLMNADVYGTDVLFGEDGISAPRVLTVKFNTYENAPPEGGNSMFIRYGGVNVASNVSLPFTLADGNWHRAVIDLTPDGHITVKVGTNPGDMTAVFSNVQIPGYVPERSIIGFGGRTGGSFALQELDNIRIGVNGPTDRNGNGIPDSCECRANFNGIDGVNVQDIFDFLAAWFAGNPRADFNGANGIGVQDIFDFLAAWFAGC